MTSSRQNLGARAERLVREQLERSGWLILAANSRTRSGEIDLIALDGPTVVFVEVKARRAGAGLGPVAAAHAVDQRKQARIRRLAAQWLAAGNCPSGVLGFRFDVVGVSVNGARAQLDHIRAAF